jgi:transcriptional regulator with XRE-family HTH domain
VGQHQDQDQDGAADFAAHIGERIRRLRNERGISLSALARDARIGKATLSGIEDGSRGNPTVETLYAVAGRLGVPLAALLPEPGRAEDRPLRAIHGTAVAASLLESFDDGPATTELYHLHIRPGPVQQSPPHPPGTVEFLTVFQGAARVGPVDAPVLIPAGGHASWTSDTPHVYGTATDEDVFASLLIRTPKLAEPTKPQESPGHQR